MAGVYPDAMTLEKLRTLCLSFPGATEQIQWGADLVFKVGGKMFCVACTEPVSPPKVAMSFKCDDETFARADRARRRDPGAVPGAGEVGGAGAVRHLAGSRADAAGDAGYEIVRDKLPAKTIAGLTATKNTKKTAKKARRRKWPARR